MNIVYNSDTGYLFVNDMIISNSPSISKNIIQLLFKFLTSLKMRDTIMFTIIKNNSNISKEIYL